MDGSIQQRYQLSADNWGRFLSLWRQWRKRGDMGRVFVISIEQAWAQYFTHISATLCPSRPRCGTEIWSTDGKLYACDHLINSQHCTGRLSNNTFGASRRFPQRRWY